MEYETNTHPDSKPDKIGGKEATASHSSPVTRAAHGFRHRHNAMSLSSSFVPQDVHAQTLHSLGPYQPHTSDTDTMRWASMSSKSSGANMEDAGRAEKRQRLSPVHYDIPDQSPILASPTFWSGPTRGTHSRRVGSSTTNQPPPDDHRVCCDDCPQNYDEVPQLIKALVELQVEMSGSTTGDSNVQNHERTVSEVTKHGLSSSLTWAVTEVRRVLGCVQEATAATAPVRSLPPLDEGVAGGKSRQSQLRIATQIYGGHHAPYTSEKASLDQHSRRLSLSQDRFLHSHESLPPIIPPDEMKRNRPFDQPPTASTASPYPSSGSSLYAPSHSPTQSHGGVGRSLPSPPGMHYPPTSLQSTGNITTPTASGAHASHLQDLQHQISTKTLALQTLQREHDQLLAAFSRSQIRCSTLDKKSQVSDHEINNLTEERIRLLQQIESLESHIEDLTKSRDEFQKQSTADGAQWRQIMAMSSQLQIKGAEEARMHKLAQQEWQRERERLEQRIRALDSGRQMADTRSQSDVEVTTEAATDDVLYSTSLDRLRNEIRSLRRRCMELEAILRDVTGETEQLGQALNAMANIRARISGRKGDNDESEARQKHADT